MEWLKNLLKNAGIEESKIDDIVTEFNKEVPKHLIPKEKYNELSEAKKKLDIDLAERDKQLETLKKSAGDNEDLKKQIQTLQDENKTAKETYELEMKDLQLTTAIKLAVASDAHDPDLITGLINREKVLLTEDGKVSGLEDQLKSLREAKAFLFVEKDGTKFKGTKPPEGSDKGSKGGQKNPWSKEHFNLTEQGRVLREDPELAKQLQAAAK